MSQSINQSLTYADSFSRISNLLLLQLEENLLDREISLPDGFRLSVQANMRGKFVDNVFGAELEPVDVLT
jgi:hypothetical protein